MNVAPPRVGHPATGFILAIGSCAALGMAGVFASALIASGWNALAAAAARIICAGIILLPLTVIAMRGQWHLARAAWKQVLWFALLAILACQVAFFISIQFIPPSLAVTIEFTGPVLLVFWIWFRTRIAPSVVTFLGVILALTGLIIIAGVGPVGESLHPLGIAFALIAAIGLAAYYVIGASASHGIAPLPFTGLGLGVAAVVMLVLGLTGLLPWEFAAGDVQLGPWEFSPVIVVLAMALVSTVMAYVLGVAASRLLGATVSSFTGYSEPLFGILWTILLLGIVPTGSQWIGAALIIGGVIAVKVGEMRTAPA